jgi:hypothetical protein
LCWSKKKNKKEEERRRYKEAGRGTINGYLEERCTQQVRVEEGKKEGEEMQNKHNRNGKLFSSIYRGLGYVQNRKGLNKAGCASIFRKRVTFHRFRWKKERKKRRLEISSKQVGKHAMETQM